MEHILILFFSFFIESMITWLYSDAWYLIFSPVFVFFIAAAVSESAPFLCGKHPFSFYTI